MKIVATMFLALTSVSCAGGPTMTDLPESVFYEGIAIDLVFRGRGPEFGDLFTVCGFENPNFPPKTRMFEGLGDMGFEQVDDFFGIRPDSEEGDDVLVWLIPIVHGEETFHNPGPFEGIRLSFNPLRHPTGRAVKFLDVVDRMVEGLPVEVRDTTHEDVVAAPDVRQRLTTDIKTITDYWEAKGVECGSPEALEVEW
jgi:hypothetical protein